MFFAVLMTLNEEEQLTFALLYEKMKELCLRAALKRTGNREMAEDAVHNAFADLIDKKEKILAMAPKNREAYVYGTVQNKVSDMYRNKKEKKEVTHATPEEFESVEDSPALHDIIGSHINEQHLMDCINSLPDIYKNVLIMRSHGYTNSEIASAFNIEAKTVSMRYARAKDILCKIINSEVKDGRPAS